MPSQLCGPNNEVRCWRVFVLSFMEQLPDDRNPSHRNTMTMLTLKPSPSDWQMLPSHGQPWHSLGEQDRECMQRGCVFVYVCEMYVDGLCEGLEGKCSRLLSLRSCQSWVDRNQQKRARAREKCPHALFHTYRSCVYKTEVQHEATLPSGGHSLVPQLQFWWRMLVLVLVV